MTKRAIEFVVASALGRPPGGQEGELALQD